MVSLLCAVRSKLREMSPKRRASARRTRGAIQRRRERVAASAIRGPNWAAPWNRQTADRRRSDSGTASKNDQTPWHSVMVEGSASS